MTESEWLSWCDPAGLLGFLRHMLEKGNRHAYRVTTRKLRLYACGLCRLQWDLLGAARTRTRRAVGVAEDFACGLTDEATLNRAGRDASDDVCNVWEAGHYPCGSCAAVFCTGADASLLGDVRRVLTALPLDLPGQAALLREIVGNPFRPLQLRCHWCGAVAPPRPVCARCGFGFGWLPHDPPADPLALATAIYADRDFAALPVLADVLEEAGCEEEDLLMHLRGRERCPVCRGTGREPGSEPEERQSCGPATCYGTGWVRLRGPHVRGCAALDAVLGKE